MENNEKIEINTYRCINIDIPHVSQLFHFILQLYEDHSKISWLKSEAKQLLWETSRNGFPWWHKSTGTSL